MNTFLNLLEVFFLSWLLVLAALVLRKLLISRQSLRGLLSTGGKGTDPERVTLLTFTIGFALFYAINTANTPIADLPGGEEDPSMPDVAPEVLIALFGVQSSYVAGKILRTLGWGVR